MKYINVVLPIPLREEFTYSVDDGTDPDDIIGRRVLVVFNKRKMTGFAVSSAGNVKNMNILPIDSILDERPVFSEIMLNFLKWMSEYYICSLGEVLKLALPSVMSESISRKLIFIKDDGTLKEPESSVLRFCRDLGPSGLDELEKVFGKTGVRAADNLKKKGLANIVSGINLRKKEILLNGFRITGKVSSDNEFSSLYSLFPEGGTILQKELKEYHISPALLKKAADEGYVERIRVRKDHFDRLMKEIIIPAPELKLNGEQEKCAENVISAIRSEKHSAFLLHGITGSGKTAVYIRLVAVTLSLNRTALILVPEISLTPQTVRQFRSHFGDTVAVIHSRQSDLERYETWEKLKNGTYKVAVGPRSALFAPLDRIGLIVVDEEHDQSYKQTDQPPRYCARNSAVMLGYMHGAPVVLGSATPSAESYYNAITGKYTLLEINKRYRNAVLPPIKLVKKERPGSIFEKYTLEVFRRELEKSRKIIVLQNRRGYSTALICPTCREPVMCPKCSVPLAYHLDRKQLICHYCGYFEKGRTTCPKCGDTNIYFKGAGTEQVEQELKRLFPDVPVYRMDQDSTRKKNAHSDILDLFGKPGSSILTGTRMIAKGLDFHDVSVVCIVNLDSELMFPDFRSDERAFQLTEQVAGRAGRGEIKGEVILQVFNDLSPVIEYMKGHDTAGFLKNELEMRKVTSYPPFSRMIKITLSSDKLPELKSAAMSVYQALLLRKTGCTIYKPAEKMILKVNNIFRLYILIKSLIINDRSGIMTRGLVSDTLKGLKLSSTIRTDIDVDPVDLM